MSVNLQNCYAVARFQMKYFKAAFIIICEHYEIHLSFAQKDITEL